MGARAPLLVISGVPLVRVLVSIFFVSFRDPLIYQLANGLRELRKPAPGVPCATQQSEA
jgi:hypothetical protein